ncbi:MAG: hypothetical protein JXB17_08745, partial [Bacteroidales bacterium]|nr:hypothetical protein [Bacteroidales bacterium]
MRNLIVFLLISVFCQAQETSLYYVIKVDGSIINVNQDKNLSTGDRILASDNLKFQTSNASALAISENSEKFSLKQPSSIDVISGAGDSFPVMLSATPVISRNQLSIRGEQDMDREIV